MVDGSSNSDDDEDNVPLARKKRTAFRQLMRTPVKITTKTVRRKAINKGGTPITKILFEKVEN